MHHEIFRFHVLTDTEFGYASNIQAVQKVAYFLDMLNVGPPHRRINGAGTLDDRRVHARLPKLSDMYIREWCTAGPLPCWYVRYGCVALFFGKALAKQDIMT